VEVGGEDAGLAHVDVRGMEEGADGGLTAPVAGDAGPDCREGARETVTRPPRLGKEDHGPSSLPPQTIGGGGSLRRSAHHKSGYGGEENSGREELGRERSPERRKSDGSVCLRSVMC
jgi:hypothetical protein